ncbi:MAG: hypothetical protein WD005_04105 [Haliea sp.]
MLKPQDIVVLCWLIVRRDEPWRYIDLASSLEISQSEGHAAANRLRQSRLMNVPFSFASAAPNTQAVEEFLVHGLRYVFYAERGPVCRGLPTSVAALPLRNHFSVGEEIPVWPDPEGEARGYSLKPLYKSVPAAARKNSALYELLALIDALRDGRARERKMAAKLLKEKLHGYAREKT